MQVGQTVVVVDTGNYKSSYAEVNPFKAILYKITDYPCYWVRSTVTGKEYELYENQILEGMTNEQIVYLIDVNKYG